MRVVRIDERGYPWVCDGPCLTPFNIDAAIAAGSIVERVVSVKDGALLFLSGTQQANATVKRRGEE